MAGKRLSLSFGLLLLLAITFTLWHSKLEGTARRLGFKGRRPPFDLAALSSGLRRVGLPGTDKTHRELYSLTTKDERYFPIDFGGRPAINPSIVTHPHLNETWVIVAQKLVANENQAEFHELACDATFKNGKLVCLVGPMPLPINATTGGKCTGDLDFLNLNKGPHDARVFHGPKSILTVYGSNSAFTCFGQWIQNFKPLITWDLDEKLDEPQYMEATELQRVPPYSIIEKNWFVFWGASEEQMYVHYDIWPQRVYALVDENGVAGRNLGKLTLANDKKCMKRLMPSVGKEGQSIHQATNSLSITMCKRSDASCRPTKANTFVFTIFHHKTYQNFHSMYEPYVMVLKQTAPFEVFGISQRPLWIHGRQRRDGPDRPPSAAGQVEETDLFYITSMSWRQKGQRYQGYLDDVLFLAFGIEDKMSAGIDVLAGELFADLGIC